MDLAKWSSRNAPASVRGSTYRELRPAQFAQAAFASGILTYRPSQSLRSGGNSATITARDRAGNLARNSWGFDVSSPDRPGIRGFTLSDASNLRPGDRITITMTGEPGGRAGFSIISYEGIRLDTRTLSEISPGVYQGSYAIPAGPTGGNFDNSTVSGTLTLPTGQTYTVRSAETITLAPGRELRQPVITSPRGDIEADQPLVVTGTAPPQTRVWLRVDYSSQILGPFRSTGRLADQMIEVGRDGRWRSEPINITSLIRGRNTVYTITASTIGRRGQESALTTLTIRRR